MEALDLLRHLKNRGASVTLAPNGLIVVAPAAVLTDADRDEIRARKPELVALLQRQQQATPTRTTLALARLTPDAAERLSGYYELARDHGFSLDDAEHIADRLQMRDRLSVDMAMCIECRHLNGRRCGAARAGQMPSTSRQFEPIRTELIRCSWYRPRSGPGK